MKNSTKFKIIQWVIKILNYYPPVNPMLSYETKKIQKIQYSTAFSKIEMEKLKEWKCIDEMVNKEISKLLLQYTDIKIEQQMDGSFKLYAQLYVMDKKNEK